MPNTIQLNPQIQKTREAPSQVERSIPLREKVTSPLPDHSEIQNDVYDGDIELGEGAKKIYSFLYSNPNRAFTKTQIGSVTGYAPRGGSFNTYLSKLNSLGLIIKKNGVIQVRELKSELIGNYDFSINVVIEKLASTPRKIYQLLLDNPYEGFSKEEIAEQLGVAVGGGSFNTYLSRLNTLGLIVKENNIIKLNPELLEI